MALVLALASAAAGATEVALTGTFGSTAAILSIDGGAPKTVKVGQSFGGVKVVGVEQDRATVEIDGKRRVLVRGQTHSSTGPSAARQSATLTAGPGGHFAAEGSVNGTSVRFLVDTGATLIALPASVAKRIGLDYRKGPVGAAQTAAGPTPAYRVKLDTVKVGGIELNNVDGVVIEQGLEVPLLGMTFLNRVDMQRDGQTMTLTRRY